MVKKTVIDSCFDESKTAKSILCFEKVRWTMLKRHIRKKSYQAYYYLLIKYLISLKFLSIDDIKKVIKRHIAITTYLYLRDHCSNKWDYKIKELDYRLDRELINIDFLLDDDYYRDAFNPFSDLYFDTDFKEIKKDIASIYKAYERLCGRYDYIEGLLNTILDYFCYGCKFADLKYYNHSDLIIARNLVDGKLEKFDFACDENELDSYWINSSPFKQVDIKEKLFGHVINIIMTNSNFDYSKEMRIMQPYYYDIMLCIGNKSLIQNSFSFFNVNTVNNTARIDITKIDHSIIFNYNGKDYMLCKDGIKSI